MVTALIASQAGYAPLTDVYTKSQTDNAISAIALTPGPQGIPGVGTQGIPGANYLADNMTNINTTLTTPNLYPTFGTLVFPIDIPAFS